MNLDPFAMIASLQASAQDFNNRAAGSTDPGAMLQYAVAASILVALSGAILEGVKKAHGK